MGPYALIDKIGESLGSLVFRARRVFTDAPVVLKLLRARAGPEFLAGARRAMSLVHPHLVPILDGGEYQDRPYIVWAPVGGMPVMEADLSLREAIGIVRDAALAVEYARGQGFIHGGLEPDCLLVSRTGSSPHADEGRRVFVNDLVLPGKAELSHFRSPEERKGVAPDARSSVYSLGAILYALVSGRAPGVAPEPLSGLNPLVDSELEAVVRKAMDPDPIRRHPQAGAFADDLTRRLSGAPAAPAKAVPRKASRRLFAGVSAGIGVMLLAGILVMAFSGDPERGPELSPAVKDAVLPASGNPVLLERTLEPPPPEPPLAVQPARITVKDAAPRATLHVFHLPQGLRKPKVALSLWSADAAVVRDALERLDPQDAGWVRERLWVLAERPEPDVRRIAAARASSAPSVSGSLQATRTIHADAEGKAELEIDGNAGPWMFFGTSEGRRDWCSDELRPELGKQLIVLAEMRPLPPPPPVAVAPPPPPPAVVKPVTPAPAVLSTASSEVGTVRFIHAAYGVFVALDAGAKVAVGDSLEVLENGKTVAQLKLERIAKPDKIYPNGSAVCRLSSGKLPEGSRVRKVAP